MIDKKIKNDDMRARFNEWHKANFKPQLKLVAKEVRITESYLNKWLKEKNDFTDKLLEQLDYFLSKIGH